jgi:putative glycosyltransferase (TIGR04372 family)
MAWERDPHGLLASTPPHLTFTKEEQKQGEAGLRKIGIPEGADYLYFYARDNAYLDASLAPPKSAGDWRYHDYRDSCIDNYMPAVEALSRRGYFAVRMGAAVREVLNTTDPKIIDYATKYRSDFLDVYLGANCRFALGDTAGIYGLPTIFRRPMAFVNYLPFEGVHSWNPQDLFIPKKLWLKNESRFMTFREILDSGAGRFAQSQRYEEFGIQAVENTPEEIHGLAVEMDERLNGAWQMTGEDEELQRRFWSLFKTSDWHGTIRSHIGTEFLRQNRELLD